MSEVPHSSASEYYGSLDVYHKEVFMFQVFTFAYTYSQQRYLNKYMAMENISVWKLTFFTESKQLPIEPDGGNYNKIRFSNGIISSKSLISFL